MKDYESGRNSLDKIIKEQYDSSGNKIVVNFNEAETRFHIIDSILTEALGWSKSEITVEKHLEIGYSDYEMGKPPLLLVEAKRESNHFTLPVGFNKQTTKIETLLSLSKNIEDAILQAINYCQKRGIPYGAICNGNQIISFVASRQDGTPPIKGKALIFFSLEDMYERFIQFWDSLSPLGIKKDTLSRVLSAQVLPPPPEKLSSSIINYPGFKNRNPIATELKVLGGLFLEDIAYFTGFEEEFLAETHCKSGALSQYALVSKEILQARYKTIFEKESKISATTAVSKKGVAPELTQDIIIAGLRRRPILLVGDIGVGKSMFIQHLIRVDAKEELKRAIVLYIDFGSKPALVEDLRPYVVGEISRQLVEKFDIDIEERNFVRGVYHGKLRRFGKGINKDIKKIDINAFRIKEIEYLNTLLKNTEEHLKSCLEHVCKAQNRNVVLFLDNVDQRAPKFQEEVFLIAQALAEHWSLTAFVSLRPDTFSQSRATGSLSAYQPRVFTIDSPRVDQVLYKRILFAKNLLEKQGNLPWLPSGFTVHSDNLLNYMKMLLFAFENQRDIIEFIDNMSCGNIRKALEFVGSFIGSGHVDSKKILEAMEKTDNYYLPLHEFLRAVIYGDNEYYFPSKAPIMNIFDISSSDSKEHFLAPLILSFVQKFGQIGSSEGYVNQIDIFNFAQELGYHPTQIRHIITTCLEKQLLATPTGLRGETFSRYRITTAGAYTYKKLIFNFAYIDAVIIDTPIIDFPKKRLIIDEHSIQHRLDRALLFLEYLVAKWTLIPEKASKTFDFLKGVSYAKESINSIKCKIN